MIDRFKDKVVDNTTIDTHIVELMGHKILVLSGEIGASTESMVRQTMMGVLDSGEIHLIIDMRDVRYMESIGLGILMTAVNRLSPYGGTVNLIGCNSDINQLINITKMSSVFVLYGNMDDAMEAIFPQETDPFSQREIA